MRPAQQHNPYHPTRPASEAIFVGREHICKRLVAELREPGRAASIVGTAGMGKTSLLLAVQRTLLTGQGSASMLVAYSGLQSQPTTLELLLKNIVVSFKAALQEQHMLHCPHGTVQRALLLAEQRAQIAEILSPLLQWAWAQKSQPYRPILLLDDIHRINDPQILTAFASVLQTVVNDGTLTCLLAGRDELVDSTRNDVSPFRMLITYNHRLGPLSKAETDVLIKKARTYGWEVEEGCTTVVYQLTGGHPYRLHYYLSDALATDDRLESAGMQQRQAIIDPYLNAVLGADVDGEADTSAYGRQFNEQVRQLVREARLEEALDMLLKASRYRDEANELRLRLSICVERERKGVAEQGETRAELLRIGSIILELLKHRR